MSSRRSVAGSTPSDRATCAFAFHDHAPGIINLVEREFRRTAHMPTAPTRRRHPRFRPF